MGQIGKRIRQIRKQKGKTLANVAGDKLSVSMLSLIENGKSNPTMDNLRHIARMLEVGVSELIGESEGETKELWRQVEEYLSEKGFTNPDRVYGLIHPHLDEIAHTYHGAEVFKMYAYLLALKGDQAGATQYIEKAEGVFLNLGHRQKATETRRDLSMFHFLNGQYEEALETILELKRLMETEPEMTETPALKIKVFYNIGGIHLALGNREAGREFLYEAAQESARTRDMTRDHEILSNGGYLALIQGDMERYRYYEDRLALLIQMTDAEEVRFAYYFLKMLHAYLIEGNPEEIIGLHALYEEKPVKDKAMKLVMDSYMNLYLGIAFFHLGEHGKALGYLSQVHVQNPMARHPYDVATKAESYAYTALIHLRKRESEEARKEAIAGREAVLPLVDHPSRDFVLSVYEEVMNQTGAMKEPQGSLHAKWKEQL